METAITFIPLLISNMFLAIISFIKTNKKQKLKYTILITIIWISTLLWTLNKFGVLTLWQ